MSEEVPSEVKPVVRMMVPCLAVEPFPEFGTVTLVGIMPFAHVESFPVTFDHMYIYVVLANALGSYDLRIDFVSRQYEEVTCRATIPTIHVPDRRILMRIEFHLASLSISSPGSYDFRLYANGEYLESATILVKSGPGG